MKTTVLAMTTALLLAGSAATTASAYDRYAYDNDRYDSRSMSSQDRDCDGIPDSRDRFVRDAHDADCDGIPNSRDHRYDRRTSSHARSDWETYGYSRGHRWSVGAYLPRNYYGSSYYIDYRPYGLEVPRYGYRWNRVGDDAYLVATDSGLIIRVEYNVFH